MTRPTRRIFAATVVAGAVALSQYGSHVAAQVAPGVATVLSGDSSDRVWARPDLADLAPRSASRIAGIPAAIVSLDEAALHAILARAPLADTAPAAALQPELALPLPDGRFSRFRIEESPILAPELAVAFPEIRTYRGTGIDDPTATTRFGWTDLGFHAIVIAADGSLYIDPYAPGDVVHYVSVRRADMPAGTFTEPDIAALAARGPEALLPVSNGTQKKTYRLALAATAEYTTAAGGTVPLALSRMTATMNRVNGIYTRDLAVSMTMSTGTGGNPTALIFTDPVTDGYTNTSGGAMLGENQTKLDAVIGSSNYDIGHVFSTGGGGVAYLGAVCNGSLKAGGVTGSSSPTGDAFDVDYVAHEMGHQFGGNHTFNSSTSNCGGGNRSASHAVEPGSGTTIMAYAGICDPEDTQRNSNDYFSIESLNEITTFLGAGGATCGSATFTGNTIPTVSAGGDFSIPKQTPFTLTASGGDANGDALTYDWEDYDLGGATTSPATMATDDGLRPLFRSYNPTSSPSRTFPYQRFILENANVPPQTFTSTSKVPGVVCSFGTCATGEALPTTNRTMKFQVTARDNRAFGGAIASALATITVVGTSGPFQVTSPNTAVSLAGGSVQAITWDVNSSNTQAANVKVSLSTDSGLTFPIVLLPSTPNDGTQSVAIPNLPTTTARIKVEAVGNIFFDISDADFTISLGPGPDAFNKSAPANGALGQSTSPTLSWSGASSATGYEYCIDTTNDNACSGWTSTGTNTSVALSGLSVNTPYYWQVRATNGSGTEYANGSSTAFWTFTTNLVQNGNFGSGAAGWATFGAPDSSYMESTIVSGVYQWRRVPQAGGQPVSQATIYQPTGVALGAGVPVSASFDIGNTSSARKYMKVLLVGDAGFSDLAACTFWLAPNAPLTTYQMRSHTTKAWTNATIYFYASSPNTDNGYYLLDNVSMNFGGAQAVNRTDCVDPDAPAPPGGAAGPNLLTNGDFGTGLLAPWGTVGTVTTQITSNVLEFYRGAVFPPPVIAQTTGQAMTANQLLTAIVQLGNSSPVRKRVLLLLNDSDFSDLTACTFWLDPGAPLANYMMMGYASKAWTNAQVSLYPSTQFDSGTPANNPWIRVDNVSLTRTPSTGTPGTTCLERVTFSRPGVPLAIATP